MPPSIAKRRGWAKWFGVAKPNQRRRGRRQLASGALRRPTSEVKRVRTTRRSGTQRPRTVARFNRRGRQKRRNELKVTMSLSTLDGRHRDCPIFVYIFRTSGNPYLRPKFVHISRTRSTESIHRGDASLRKRLRRLPKEWVGGLQAAVSSQLRKSSLIPSQSPANAPSRSTTASLPVRFRCVHCRAFGWIAKTTALTSTFSRCSPGSAKFESQTVVASGATSAHQRVRAVSIGLRTAVAYAVSGARMLTTRAQAS